MEHDSENSGDFQRSTRMPLDAVVRLHFEGTVAYQNGFAANVSATGMFVKHPSPPPVGTKLVFEFSLGVDRVPVQGSGDVVWTRDRYLGPGQPAGVGIRFHQLDAQSRDHIAEALFEYLERSLSETTSIDAERLAGQIGAEPAAVASLAGAFSPAPPEPPAPRIEIGTLPPITRPGAEPAPASAPVREPLEPVTTAALSSYAPPPEADERQPFTVFSSLDSADAGTAAIVREALRDQPPALTLGGAAHARSERAGSSTALWVALVLAGVAVGGWFLWQRYAARPAAPEPQPVAAEPAKPAPEPLSATPDTSTTLAQAVGVDPTVRSPATEPPISQKVTGAPAESQPDETEAPAEPDSGAATADSPVATETPVTIPAPPEPAPATAPAGEPAKSVAAISWLDSAGANELVIRGDSAFAAGSWSYSEIGGENPRVLVKIRGMQSPFRGAAGGASPLARGVRTGYHVGNRGNEIHVVVDLAPPAAKVASLAPEGSTLVLRFTPR